MLLTVVGAMPAIDLLRNRNKGRINLRAALAMFALVSMIGAVAAGSGMREKYYSSYSSDYYYSSNETGFAIAVIDAIVVGIWCVIGIFYLKSSRVKTWFQK